jgi:hypothetical protein
MSSVRPVIDQAFRRLLDNEVGIFKADAAQTIKEALRDLDHVLKSKSFITLCIPSGVINTDLANNSQMTRRHWHVTPTSSVSRKISSATSSR